jgi:hypothetical protein
MKVVLNNGMLLVHDELKVCAGALDLAIEGINSDLRALRSNTVMKKWRRNSLMNALRNSRSEYSVVLKKIGSFQRRNGVRP